MATRYWVNNGGNWSDTSHWSDTNGGSGGFSVPGSADVATFTSASGTGTATIDQTVRCTTLTIQSGTSSSFNIYQPNAYDVNISGSITMGSPTSGSYWTAESTDAKIIMGSTFGSISIGNNTLPTVEINFTNANNKLCSCVSGSVANLKIKATGTISIPSVRFQTAFNIAGVLDIDGYSATYYINFNSNTASASRKVSAGSVGSFSNVTFTDIDADGTSAPWLLGGLPGIVDGGRNTDIDFVTAPAGGGDVSSIFFGGGL